MSGQVLDYSGVMKLEKMPTKQELMATIARLIKQARVLQHASPAGPVKSLMHRLSLAIRFGCRLRPRLWGSFVSQARLLATALPLAVMSHPGDVESGVR